MTTYNQEEWFVALLRCSNIGEEDLKKSEKCPFDVSAVQATSVDCS
jgi:hypothetical protein